MGAATAIAFVVGAAADLQAGRQAEAESRLVERQEYVNAQNVLEVNKQRAKADKRQRLLEYGKAVASVATSGVQFAGSVTDNLSTMMGDIKKAEMDILYEGEVNAFNHREAGRAARVKGRNAKRKGQLSAVIGVAKATGKISDMDDE